MAWKAGEVWFDADVLWFEQPQMLGGGLGVALPAGATALFDLLFEPVGTGLEASRRRRRLAAQAARRRRLATRTVPAVALLVGSATMLPIAALRHRGGIPEPDPLLEDAPSLTFRLDWLRFQPPQPSPEKTKPEPDPKARVPVRVHWHHATSIGLQYAGSLAGGTQLPVEGPDWVTWNPATDSSPNLPNRLYGHERTIHAVIAVLGAYRAAHPDAPRVVVGDISFRHGGRMDQHVSHQNGLDVDVYYPRRDRHLGAPVTTSQIDRPLAQDLLDGFVAAGAKIVFVGYATGLRGPTGVVVPYPNHENHMHVRFPVPP
jgi:murein endopeptidase